MFSQELECIFEFDLAAQHNQKKEKRKTPDNSMKENFEGADVL